MTDLRSNPVQTPESSSVPVPDFSPIVKQHRSPVLLILTVLAMLAAAALFILAKGGA